MKRILLFFILAAAVMYGILHGNLWRNNLYWISFYGQTSSVGASPSYETSGVTQLPPTAVERRSALDTCLLKPAFDSLLGVDKIYPFLCANDFIRVAEFQGSDKFELPYGIKRAEQFFRLALSRLESCGLSNEDDNIACRRCVVVGNGGVLRNKTLGEKIDSYDVIIRMNNGPVIGYEEDVGRRTTFRLFYPESMFSDPIHYDPNTTVVLIVFKPRDLKWLWKILSGQKISDKGFWKKPAKNMIYKSSQIRILDPSITRKTAYELLRFPTRFPKKEKPKHPTTGLIAITLAFHICHEVHLAGFKYDFTDRNSSLHYYGNETMSQMMQLPNPLKDRKKNKGKWKELRPMNLQLGKELNFGNGKQKREAALGGG
ncbi:type 2 lactosamine alpha-2,3-sialyltransferase isoform X2 [Pipra filicauda]|uniref:Type 2 lactosamine alpha-2,3-sialyltransferase n=1 Tax=Pipra filicauda TaxID=649802 RepID=A0A7R5L405_9PASS|nr:type 2 lactosamine alpha-2,3-sialyltransferase isoform X2 [Pipra filicauda]XP_039244379.1 type 2 lactosamine alpha-2,3-sialyltransferase isoform X2 [Pipra filicauda]